MREVLADAPARGEGLLHAGRNRGDAGLEAKVRADATRQIECRFADRSAKIEPLFEIGRDARGRGHEPPGAQEMQRAFALAGAGLSRQLDDGAERGRPGKVRQRPVHRDPGAHLDAQRLVRLVDQDMVDRVAEEVGFGSRLGRRGRDFEREALDVLAGGLARRNAQDMRASRTKPG